MMASSRRSPGSGHGVGVMLAQIVPLVFHARALPPLSLSFANKIATIYASRLLQLHIYFYLTLPIKLI